MDISDIYLFCSTTSKACEPCFAFIRDNPLLVQEIQLIRLDTKKVREKVKRGASFQIQAVPTLIVIYQDGDTSLYKGQQKVLTWLFMRVKTFEQIRRQSRAGDSYLAPSPQQQEISRTPRSIPPAGEAPGLYSGKTLPSSTPEPEIEYFPSGAAPQPPQRPPDSASSTSSLDINARRKDKDTGMGNLVSAARKMEESRQSHLAGGSPPGARAPAPIKQF